MAEKGRGFAAMDQQKQREIASRGGRAAHRRGTAHQFTTEEAAAAGRKGGQSVSRNREHMAKIGRKGGLATHKRNPGFPSDKSSNQPATAENASANRPAEAARPPMEAPLANPTPEERRAEVAVYHQPLTNELPDDGDLDNEEMLDEGRMGNENATEEHNLGPTSGAHFEEEGEGERTGGHGYGSFEDERSPQQSRR